MISLLSLFFFLTFFLNLLLLLLIRSFDFLIINLKVYYFYYFRDGYIWDTGTTNYGYMERNFFRVTRQDRVFYEGLLRWTTLFGLFTMEQVLVHQYSNSMI
jgi:hypothetical protein